MSEPAPRILSTVTNDTLVSHSPKTVHGRLKKTNGIYQKTLNHPVTVRGTSVTATQPLLMILRPAPINTGIFFKRVDLLSDIIYPVNLTTAQVTPSEIHLKQGEATIKGIEHLMSVLFGLGIDNVQIDLHQEEIPMMDNSVEPLTFLIQAAGLLTQTALKQFLVIKQAVRVNHLNAWAEISPSNQSSFDISSTLFHPTQMTQEQHYKINLTPSLYRKSLSRARHNAHQLPPKEQRYADETIRHHLIDIIGDISLLNHTIVGQLRTHNTNHLLNNRLLKQLIAQESAWETADTLSHTQESSETIYY